MLCAKCGKNEATVYFKSVINGEKTEQHLCSDCAKESGVMKNFDLHRNVIQNNFFGRDFFSPFSSLLGAERLLSGFVDDDFFGSPGLLEKNSPEKCPYCGTTLENFKKTGKFGCGMCYETFKDSMDMAVKTADVKSEPKNTADSRIERLRRKIDLAISSENYEDAAKYRDEIKKLKQEGK